MAARAMDVTAKGNGNPNFFIFLYGSLTYLFLFHLDAGQQPAPTGVCWDYVFSSKTFIHSIAG